MIFLKTTNTGRNIAIKQLSDLLKQWLQILEQDEKAFINKTGRFKNELEAWFNIFKAKGTHSKVKDHTKSGNMVVQKSHKPDSKAVIVNSMYRELQQLPWKTTHIPNTAQQEKETEVETETSGSAFERLKTFVSTTHEDLPPEEENSREALQADDIYIQNAGLVIVWPFFKELFEALGLTEAHQFTEEATQYRAIQLLQYLAGGEEGCEEYLLGLNKLLCGLALHEPVPRQISLSEKEKESAEELIKAAINHWPMMKNTSVEGFRQAFLLRDGKLSRNTDGWLLQAEQKSYDMIMDKIPWSIGLVKLPWMPEALFVEW